MPRCRCQERYLAKVKALLHQELSAENGAGGPNGSPGSGAYGSDEDSERAGADGDEDGAMELEEAAAAASSPSCSVPAARARKSRRSRSNGDAKSNGRGFGVVPGLFPVFGAGNLRGGSPREWGLGSCGLGM